MELFVENVFLTLTQNLPFFRDPVLSSITVLSCKSLTATSVSHINNFKFLLPHLKKAKETADFNFINIPIWLNISNAISTYNQQKYWDFTFFFYTVFRPCMYFYTHITPQFILDIFQVLNRHTLLVATIFDGSVLDNGSWTWQNIKIKGNFFKL